MLQKVEMKRSQLPQCHTQPLSIHPPASPSPLTESSAAKPRRGRRARRKHEPPLKLRKSRYKQANMHSTANSDGIIQISILSKHDTLI